MRRLFITVCLALCCTVAGAATQVSISIGINVPVYPRLAVVPGYPVYYAPALPANYFFYDGMYWVFVGDEWYMSSWYNGPWMLVSPVVVPYYVLRVPVRYYRAPPPWFRDWSPAAPPRWGQHWGPQWEQQHRGWDRWNRQAAPPPAPLPAFQRRYAGERYPRIEQQRELQGRNYHYQPRSVVAKQHYRDERIQRPAPRQAPSALKRESPVTHEGRSPAQPRHDMPLPTGAGNQPQPRPQQQAPGHAAPQERGHGKGHSQEHGKEKREERGGRGAER